MMLRSWSVLRLEYDFHHPRELDFECSGNTISGLVTRYDHSDHAITLPLYCDRCDWEIFGWSHSITLSVLEYLQGLVPSVIASVIV
jgi:hypothetical protein